MNDIVAIKVIGISMLIFANFCALNGKNEKCSSVFEIIFLLYSVFYPIFWLIAGDVITGFSAETIHSSLNLYMYFLLFYMVSYRACAKYFIRIYCNSGLRDININVNILIFLVCFFVVLYSYSIVQVISSGGLTKSERMISGTASFQTFHGAIYVLIGVMYSKYRIGVEKQKIKIFFIFLTLYFLALYPILNERDQVILPIAHILIMMYLYKDVKSTQLKIAGLILVLFFTIFGYIRSLDEGDFDLIFAIGQNEFIFSARNLAYVLENKISMESKSIIGDFTAVFGVGQTGVSWFNENVYENKGMGVIVEMYLNFGVLGVIALGLIYGITIGYIDGNDNFKNYSIVIFKSLLFLSLLYSIRSDLAIITTTLLKKYLIMIIILSIIEKIKPLRKR